MKAFLDKHPSNKIWLYNFCLEELHTDILQEITILDEEDLALKNTASKIKQRILTECPGHYHDLEREMNHDN